MRNPSPSQLTGDHLSKRLTGAALILPAAIAHARQRTGLIPFDTIRIVPALLGPDAPLLGAAAVLDHNFITTD